MTGRGLRTARSWTAGVVLALPFVVGAAAGDAPVPGEVVLVMTDPEIVESSGLAMVPAPVAGPGPLLATVNDSGDTGRVFAVDPGTGETVGVTTWSGDPVDVEALAPAGPGEVWVGDIGDNLRSRDSVEVARVPVGRGSTEVAASRWTLTWPDGARDAEALLTHPVTGRLHLVSKGVFGGELVAAPEELDPDGPNALTEFGPVAGLVTDGAFWPDGRHLLLRTYDRLHVYTHPALEHVADLDLPAQPQGEGLVVTGAGEVWLSTEGADSEVLRFALPADVRRLLEEPAQPAEPADRAEPRAAWWQRVLRALLPSV